MRRPPPAGPRRPPAVRRRPNLRVLSGHAEVIMRLAHVAHVLADREGRLHLLVTARHTLRDGRVEAGPAVGADFPLTLARCTGGGGNGRNLVASLSGIV